MRTGMFCIKYLLMTLADEDKSDLALSLVDSHGYPSYGYMLDHGATTLWERYVAGAASENFLSSIASVSPVLSCLVVSSLLPQSPPLPFSPLPSAPLPFRSSPLPSAPLPSPSPSLPSPSLPSPSFPFPPATRLKLVLLQRHVLPQPPYVLLSCRVDLPRPSRDSPTTGERRLLTPLAPPAATLRGCHEAPQRQSVPGDRSRQGRIELEAAWRRVV